jgi:hypothetical protein
MNVMDVEELVDENRYQKNDGILCCVGDDDDVDV